MTAYWGKPIVVLVALLFLSGCSPDRGSQIRLAPGQRIAGGIAVEEVDGSPFVWGEINGQRYRFLMDTGATGFLLTDHMVVQSGLEYDPTLSMKGHGIGGPVTMKMVKAVSIKLDNGLSLDISHVAVRPEGDGCFPYMLLKSLDMIWDIKAGTIYIRHEEKPKD